MEFHNLDNTKAIEFAPGAKVKFVHSENMTVAMWELDAGLDVPARSHHHEQIVLLHLFYSLERQHIEQLFSKLLVIF